MATKLLKWGNGVGLLVPSFAAKSCGFKPGTFVRIIVLDNEIRVRPVSTPCVDDYSPLDDESPAHKVGRLETKW